MKKFASTILLLAAMLAFVVAPSARADQWNQKTVFTFSGPVEIPGQVLPAGSYVFKLLDSPSNRHIVQVFNADESKIFGTFLAIPDYRMRVSDKTIITFNERPASMPEAVKAWFYPGRNYGHEFVYPKQEALALARANHTPVPSMPDELAASTVTSSVAMSEPEIVALDKVEVMAEEPSGEEVMVAEAFATTAPELPTQLPSTATSLPVIGLIGLLSLAAAFTLRFSPAK